MFTTFLLSLSLIGQADSKPETPPKQPSQQEITSAIEQLGSSEFAAREEAMKFLWRAGRIAEPALAKAATSSDREVSYRANHILERFRLGIFADTPPEVIGLIQQYKRGDYNVKRAVLGQLNAQKRLRTMLTLLRGETDANIKRALAQQFVSTAGSAIGQAILDGEMNRVEELLEWVATFDTTGTQLRNYAAFMLLHDKVDQKIAQLKALPNVGDQKENLRMIAYLLKSKRDFAQAREYAQKADDKKLVADMHYRLNDWKALAQADMIPGDRGIESLGFSAAFHKLAGNHDESEKAVMAIKSLANDDGVSKYMCAEALMISDHWQAAIDLQTEESPNNSFRVLCEQARFSDAFKLMKVDEPRTKSVEWFQSKTKGLDPTSKEFGVQFNSAIEVARGLYRVYERDETLRLLDELKKNSLDEKGTRLRLLVAAEMKMGLKDVAFKHAQVSLSDPAQRTAMLSTLFRTQSAAAQALFSHLVLTTSATEEKTALQKLDELLEPDEALSTEKLQPVLDAVVTNILAAGTPQQRAGNLKAIAEVCKIHEQWELAKTYYEKELGVQSSADVMIRIGDMLAKAEQWDEAANWFDKAWQEDKANSLALYLFGHALQQTGKQEEGKRLVKLATVLPLADIVKRQTLASGLAERELLDQAKEQWELMLLLGPFDAWEGSQAWAVRDAARNMGYYIAEKDKLRSASLRRRRIFYLLKTNSSFIDIEYYARVMHLIHKTQAQGLLESGKTDEAIEEIWLAHKARPDEVDLVLDLIEKLQTAGRNETANSLFQKTYDVYERVCQNYPNSAHHHNNLAWLAARSNRKLDEALRHAKLAVEIRPEYSAYVDTLGECYFRNGDRENAIKTAQRALELDPKNEFFKEQLERFQKE